MNPRVSAPRSALPLRAPVPRELLGRPAVSALLRQALTEWALILACQGGMAWLPAATPLLVVLIAGRLHALGVILHDAVHLSVRHKGPGLRLLELLAGYPIASTWDAMRYHHLRHHQHEGSPLDGYSRPKPGPWWRTLPKGLALLFIVPGWTVRGLLGVLACAVPALRNPYGRVFLMDRSGKDLTHDAQVLACARAERGQVLFQLGVLALAWRWPHTVGLGYLLPLMLASALCGYRLLAEHTPVTGQGRTLQALLASTADHGQGWLGRLLLAPRNVGCHIVHHLHPQVAADHLPRLRAWYLRHYPEHYPRPRRL